MAQTTGILDVYWRGQFLNTKPNVQQEIGGMRNASVMGARRNFRAQSFKPSKITAEIIMTPGLDTAAMFAANIEDELQVKWDTGQTYTWPDAFITDVPKMTGGENGTLSVTWECGEPTVTL